MDLDRFIVHVRSASYFMLFYGDLWDSMGLYGYMRYYGSSLIHGSRWLYIVLHVMQWGSIGIYGVTCGIMNLDRSMVYDCSAMYFTYFV